MISTRKEKEEITSNEFSRFFLHLLTNQLIIAFRIDDLYVFCWIPSGETGERIEIERIETTTNLNKITVFHEFVFCVILKRIYGTNINKCRGDANRMLFDKSIKLI